MKQPEELSTKEIEEIMILLMDGRKQEQLISSDSENKWQLAYVYDSKLSNNLGEVYQVKKRIESLEKKLNINEKEEIKTKI